MMSSFPPLSRTIIDHDNSNDHLDDCYLYDFFFVLPLLVSFYYTLRYYEIDIEQFILFFIQDDSKDIEVHRPGSYLNELMKSLQCDVTVKA